MPVQKIWANMAVANLSRTAKFYTALGCKPNGSNNAADLVSFLFGDNDFIIHFFLDKPLAKAMSGKLANHEQGNEIIFSIAAEDSQAVDAWVDKVIAAGGQIHRQPGFDENGYYYCVFADPDGHRFNVLSMTDGM